MEQLRVIGTEDDKLVLATESGERFVLEMDDVLRHEVRKARREREPEDSTPRVSPREIQAQIRAGLSANEVAELLGARLEDIRRFEGPVLAEREHVIGLALAVPVLVANDLDHDGQPTFGDAIRGKLEEGGASGERWTSWKDADGWVVKLEFAVGEIDHDARWGFEPRRGTLAPQNADAIQLSRQGALPDGLIPRLRALDSSAQDDSRFENDAFSPRRTARRAEEAGDTPPQSPADPQSRAAIQQAAAKHATPDQSPPSHDTADLLEALRRRRGQRDPLPDGEDDDRFSSARPIALFDAIEADSEQSQADSSPAPTRTDSKSDSQRNDGQRNDENTPAEPSTRRRGRPSMPSWDEIVFGARSDD